MFSSCYICQKNLRDTRAAGGCFQPSMFVHIHSDTQSVELVQIHGSLPRLIREIQFVIYACCLVDGLDLVEHTEFHKNGIYDTSAHPGS